MPSVQISTGISVYYEWHGEGDGVPVVFIRGTGADSSRWMPQVNEYKDKYRTIIFDFLEDMFETIKPLKIIFSD